MSGLISYGPYVGQKTIPERQKNVKFVGELTELASDSPLRKVKGFFPSLNSTILSQKLQIHSETLYIHYVFSYESNTLDIKYNGDFQEVFLDIPECPRYRAIHKAFEEIHAQHMHYSFECSHTLQIQFPSGPVEVAALCIFSWDSPELTSSKILCNLTYSNPSSLFQPFQFILGGEPFQSIQLLPPLPLLDLFLEIQYILNMKHFVLTALESHVETINFVDTLLAKLEGEANTNGNPTYIDLMSGIEATDELKAFLALIAREIIDNDDNRYFITTNDYWNSKYSFRDLLFFTYIAKNVFQVYETRLLNSTQYYKSPAIGNTFYNKLFKKNREIFDARGFVVMADVMLKQLPPTIVSFFNDSAEKDNLAKAADFFLDSFINKEVIVPAIGSQTQSMRLPLTLLQRGVAFSYTMMLQRVDLSEYKSNFFKEWLDPISNQDYQLLVQATDPPELLLVEKGNGNLLEFIPSDKPFQQDKLIKFEASHWLKDVFDLLYPNEYYAYESFQNITPDQRYFLNKKYLSKVQQQKMFVSAETFKIGNKLRIPISEIQSVYYIPILKKEIRQGNATTNSYATNAPALAGTPYTLQITLDLPIDTTGYYDLDAYVTYTKESKTYKQEIAGFLGPFFQNGTTYEMYHFMSVEVPSGIWPYATFECVDVEISYLKLVRYRDSWTPFFFNSFRDAKEKEEAQQTMLRTFQFSEKQVNSNTGNYDNSFEALFKAQFLQEVNPEEGLFSNLAETIQEEKNCTWFVLDVYSLGHLSNTDPIERYRIVYTFDAQKNSWSYQMYQTQKGISKRMQIIPTILQSMIVHMPLFSNSLKEITLEDSTLLGEAKYQLAMDGSEYLQLAMITQTMILAIAPSMSRSETNILLQYEDTNYVKKYMSPQCLQPLQSISYPLVTSYTFGSSPPSIREVVFFNQRHEGIFRASKLNPITYVFRSYRDTYYENQFNESIAREWNFLCSVYKTYSTLDKETYFSFLPRYRKLINDFRSRPTLEESILRDLRSLARTPTAVQSKYKLNLPKAFALININAKERTGVSTLDRKVVLYLKKVQSQINKMRSNESISVPKGEADVDARVKLLVDTYWRKTWKDFAAVEAFAKGEFARTQREIQVELDTRAEIARKKEAARLAEEKRIKLDAINTKISGLESYKATQVRESLTGYNQQKINALIGPYKNFATTKAKLVEKFQKENLTEKYEGVLKNLDANKGRFNTQFNVEKQVYQKQKNDLALKKAEELQAARQQLRPFVMYLKYLDSQLNYILEMTYGSDRVRDQERNAIKDKLAATKNADAFLNSVGTIEDLAKEYESMKETYRRRKIATYAAAKCDLYSRRVNLPRYNSITEEIIRSANYSMNLEDSKIVRLLNNPLTQRDLDLGIDYIARYYCNVSPDMLSKKQNFERNAEEEARRQKAAAEETKVQETIRTMNLTTAQQIQARKPKRAGSPPPFNRRIMGKAEEIVAENNHRRREASARYVPSYVYNESGTPVAMSIDKIYPIQVPSIPTNDEQGPLAPQGFSSRVASGLGSVVSGVTSGLGSVAKSAASAVVERGRSLVSASQQKQEAPNYPSSSSYQPSGTTRRGRAGSPQGRRAGSPQGNGRGGGRRKTMKKKVSKTFLKRRKSRGRK